MTTHRPVRAPTLGLIAAVLATVGGTGTAAATTRHQAAATKVATAAPAPAPAQIGGVGR